MYLTRMELDTRRRSTLKLLASSGFVHGLVESSFKESGKRHLWRIDVLGGKTYLMILSDEKPDLAGAADKYGIETEPKWETKTYDVLLDRVKNGSIWQFRLVANPTKSEFIRGKDERGRVKACSVIKEQKEWLLKRGEKNGFEIVEDNLYVTENKWHIFEKGSKTRRRVYIKGAAFEGVLRVTEENSFKNLLTLGMGRGKAYGMGLMTLIAR